MAKTVKKKAAFASLNPDDMLQGGLPTDFRGVVTDASYVEWDYEGKSDKPVLAVKLTIQPEDGDINQGNPIVQHWSAGNLKDWAPGDTDGDQVEEGPCAIRVGKRTEMNNNTNFAHLMQTILESGAAAKGKPFTAKNLTTEITCLVGLDAHWDRVPQKKRAGMVDRLADADDDGGEDEDEEKKPAAKSSGRDILVVTEVFGYNPDGDAKPAKKSTKAAAAEEDEEETEEDEEEVAKPKKKVTKPADDEDEEEEAEAGEEEAETEEDPFDAALAKAVKAEIKKAGGSLKKNKLSTLMLKAYAAAKPKEKSKAVERATEDEFLSDAARPWEFDEETGVLTLS